MHIYNITISSFYGYFSWVLIRKRYLVSLQYVWFYICVCMCEFHKQFFSHPMLIKKKKKSNTIGSQQILSGKILLESKKVKSMVSPN